MEDFFEDFEKPERFCKKCGKCNGKKPNSTWDKIPDGCGFEGWFFQKREEIKQHVRKQKELLLLRQASLNKAGPEQTKKLNESIQKIKNIIESYSEYGSHDW